MEQDQRQHVFSHKRLKQEGRQHTVTLVYGARDEEHNAARGLKSVLEGRARTGG